MEEIESLLPVYNHLGESPIWHPLEQSLYWVDICDYPAIYRFKPAEKNLQIFPVGLAVSALGWRKVGGLIAATRGGLAYWSLDSGLKLLANPLANNPDARLNDGAVDGGGRFWIGSMQVGAETSNLFRYGPGSNLVLADTGFIVSNGMGWSPDGLTMYFTDSYRHTIYAYDFNPKNGSVLNRHVFVTTSSEPGVPDGLTVDRAGGVWSVFCRGGKIVRYTSSGDKDFEIELPVSCPTSCTFGGMELDDLYITSSRSLVDPDERNSEPLAGNLFRIRTGYFGFEEQPFLS